MKISQIVTNLALLGSLLITTSIYAEVIADYRKDFRAQKPLPGWNYKWNPTGVSVGNAAAYEVLRPIPDAYAYCVDPMSPPGNSSTVVDGRWLKISKLTLNPGSSATKSSDKLEHYIITAYTVQPGEAGTAQIINSQVKRHDPKNLAASSPIKIYVNDTLIGSDNISGIEAFAFNAPLGELKEGDTVYVAYGTPADSFPVPAGFLFQIDVTQ